MPVERREVSVSQFAELMGLEPERLIAVERRGSTMVLVLEPEAEVTQTMGTFPQLKDNTSRRPPRKGGKKGR